MSIDWTHTHASYERDTHTAGPPEPPTPGADDIGTMSGRRIKNTHIHKEGVVVTDWNELRKTDNDAFLSYRGKWRVFDVCEEIHMSCTGSADPMSDDELSERLTWLRCRLSSWFFFDASWAPYDEAVRDLIVATLVVHGRRKP